MFANLYNTDNSNGMAFGWVIMSLALALLYIAALWRVFEKAKQSGWKAIIPFYNIYIMLKIVGRPGWWLLLYLIPVVNIFVHIVVSLDLAKAFGKSATFGIFGLWLFSFIGYVILGFGEAQYKGAPKH